MVLFCSCFVWIFNLLIPLSRVSYLPLFLSENVTMLFKATITIDCHLLINKQTKLFHCLFLKGHRIDIKISKLKWICHPLVLLQIFKHFHVISVVYESINNGKF